MLGSGENFSLSRKQEFGASKIIRGGWSDNQRLPGTTARLIVCGSVGFREARDLGVGIGRDRSRIQGLNDKGSKLG